MAGWRSAGAALALLVAAFVAPAAAAPTPGELDSVRRQCVAAARETQQREQAVAALERDIDLRGRDADARRRGLDETRPEQARLLGALAHLARHPPDKATLLLAAPVDRLRGDMLMQAALPGLRAQSGALSKEIVRVAALRQEIVAKQITLTTAREALATERAQLAALAARRTELTRELLPADAAADSRIARIAREANNIDELIRNVDAATERRDKELLARARATRPTARANSVTAETADPTRPSELRAFDPPHSALLMPVAGTISQRFGASDGDGTASSSVSVAVLPGAAVVAPFDGRIAYAGSYRDLGLVLIIRHGGAYHSVLTGLDRVDINLDQWVVAGEPVGATRGGPLLFELRRDGRPVDPQPWLANRDEGDDERNGDQRVRR